MSLPSEGAGGEMRLAVRDHSFPGGSMRPYVCCYKLVHGAKCSPGKCLQSTVGGVELRWS